MLLDQCGWQSVFYFSGGLTLLWAYYVYRYLLNEKGNCSHVASPLFLSPPPPQLCFKHQQIKETIPLKNSLVSTLQGW